MSIALIVLLLVVVSGCDMGADNLIQGNGTIIYSDIEGGCWWIRSDDGTFYEPWKMDRQFKVDSLRVHFVLEISEGASYCGSGAVRANIIRMWTI